MLRLAIVSLNKSSNKRLLLVRFGTVAIALCMSAQSVPPNTPPTKSGSAVSKPDTGGETKSSEDQNQCKSDIAPVNHTLTCNVVQQAETKIEGEKAKADSLDTLTRRYMWATIVGVVIALFGVGALIAQTILYRRSSERQLRAYVVCDVASVFNVANPIAVYPGQVFVPTGAEIGNPGAGPGAIIQIKNTGDTPAYDVVHWGNICFREYPLLTSLPARLPTLTNLPKGILGSGVTATKFLQLNPALTEPQIASLRAGTEVVYAYGEITYKDAFGKQWYTRYRTMYHPMSGAVGVSTTLSLCEDGNTGT
jgi:hypothetical protein